MHRQRIVSLPIWWATLSVVSGPGRGDVCQLSLGQRKGRLDHHTVYNLGSQMCFRLHSLSKRSVEFVLAPVVPWTSGPVTSLPLSQWLFEE